MDNAALLIPVTLAQAVLDYLASRPYREVAPLIEAMKQMQPEAKPEPEAVTEPAT